MKKIGTTSVTLFACLLFSLASSCATTKVGSRRLPASVDQVEAVKTCLKIQAGVVSDYNASIAAHMEKLQSERNSKLTPQQEDGKRQVLGIFKDIEKFIQSALSRQIPDASEFAELDNSISAIDHVYSNAYSITVQNELLPFGLYLPMISDCRAEADAAGMQEALDHS